MRGHLRNLEIYMARLVEETGQGRAQSTNDIRNEIKILTRTIAAIAEEQPRGWIESIKRIWRGLPKGGAGAAAIWMSGQAMWMRCPPC